MRSVSLQYAAVGLLITATVAASALSVLDASASTYMAVVGVILGAASVILISWRNALPTDTVGQLLQRTEANERPGRIRVRDASGDSR